MSHGPGCTAAARLHLPPRRWHGWLLMMALAAWLAGCALSPLNLPQGTPRADVIARLGTPFAALPLPDGGERWLYTTQPAGREVYHVELDGAGHVVRTEQVLTSARLSAMLQSPAPWTAQDVRNTFGPPMAIERVASFQGDVWTYRFLEPINLRRLAHVHIDPSGTVRKLLFTDEPQPGNDRIP